MGPLRSMPVFGAQYSIGEADIASLTIQTQSTPGSTPPCTKHPPAVEAPVIGSLYIKDLATGTVWSGQHEEFDPDSGYAAIDDLRIGFMRRYSAVRVTGWSSFVVEHNMFGDIHVPEVPEGSLIEIGGILGNDENSIYEGDLAHELCSLQVNGGWPRSLQSANSCHRSPVPPAIGACLAARLRTDEGCRWRGKALRASHR